MGGVVGGWVKVEVKAISAQPTEVGVGLSWAELGKKKCLHQRPGSRQNYSDSCLENSSPV